MTYTMFKFPVGNPDTETMRKYANDLDFDETSVFYYRDYIGFKAKANAAPDDPELASFKDTFKENVGIRPEIVEVEKPDWQDE